MIYYIVIAIGNAKIINDSSLRKELSLFLLAFFSVIANIFQVVLQ